MVYRDTVRGRDERSRGGLGRGDVGNQENPRETLRNYGVPLPFPRPKNYLPKI